MCFVKISGKERKRKILSEIEQKIQTERDGEWEAVPKMN